jgi:diguanylate cyclase (GGDEF)-like protein
MIMSNQKFDLLEKVFHTSNDYLIVKDVDGRWIEANQKTLRLFEIEDGVYRGKTDVQLAHLYPRFANYGPICVHSDNQAWVSKKETQLKESFRMDGMDYTFHVRKIPLYDEDGHADSIVVVGSNITEQEKYQAIQDKQYKALQMIASGEKLADVFRNIVDAVEALSVNSLCSIMFYEESDNWLRNGYSHSFSDSFLKKIDRFPVGLHYASCGHAAFTKEIAIVSDIETDLSWSKWKEIPLAFQLRSCWSIPILSSKGELFGTFAIYHPDVRKPQSYEIELLKVFSYLTGLAIERDNQVKEIQYLASHDTLTNLPNIRFLKDVIERLITRQDEFAILFIDLDRFKPINDTFGHAVGDKVLSEVARRIHLNIPKKGIVSRMGGDEFVILLRKIKNEQKPISVAEELLQAIKEPILINDREFYVSASIGISMYPFHGHTGEILIRNADVAMYSVKGDDGQSIQMFNDSLTKHGTELFMLQGELREAIKHNQFFLQYQPKLELATGTFTGLEALIRWKHPEKGIISPDTFIPLAEESGVIGALGEWVLREVCKQVKKWKEFDLTHLPVAVNVSVRQIVLDDIPSLVESILAEFGLPSESIEIEITESVLSKHEYLIQNAVSKLQEIGVKVSIDDFGTGYASMTYLKQFRANKIKIDRSFISSLPHDVNEAAIVSAVITLARDLQMDVIAEGIETKEQLDFLLEKGCLEGQGYYYSRPVSSNQIEELLQKGNEMFIQGVIT